MLDQNTDRMWFVIGAVIVGAAIIFIANGSLPTLFASVTDTFNDTTNETLYITKDFEVLGKTTQDGTPSPLNRVPIRGVDKFNAGIVPITLPKPLHAVGESQDRLFLDTDNKWKIERQTGHYVFKGTETLTRNGWSGVTQEFNRTARLYHMPESQFENIYRRGDMLFTHGPDKQVKGFEAGVGATLSHPVVYFNIAEAMGEGNANNHSEFIRDWLHQNQAEFVYERLTPKLEVLPDDLQETLNELLM